MHISNRIVRPKKYTYKTWWSNPVESTQDEWETSYGNISHGMYVVNFYNNLRALLASEGYNIKNEKQFKSEIATFIYNLSDDHI